jgi:hypothetical protein
MTTFRALVALVSVSIFSLLMPADRGLAQEVLTNDSVVQMVKAGLPESVIVAKIRSTSTKFDLRTDALVTLKKAGVSDKVLEAMVAQGSPATGTLPPSPATMAAAPPGPTMGPGKDRDVVYHLTGDKYVELDPAVAELETNFAFFQSKSEIVLPGKKAKYRVMEKQPVFLTTYSPTEAPLVRLKPGDDHDDRNLKVSSGAFMPFGGTHRQGVRNEDKIAVTSERDPRGFYRVTPAAPLAPGEYGFVVTQGFIAGASGRIFDFGTE